MVKNDKIIKRGDRQMDTQELVKFENGEVSLNVPVGVNNDTVWLTQEDMAMLFEKNKSTISRHVKNIFEEGELEEISSIAKNATQLKKYDPRTGKDRLSNVEIIYYNLDVIISVGYRVKSKQGIIFRKWANNILKEYMLKGYVLDAKKFKIPTIENIARLLEQERKISGNLQLTGEDMLDFILSYNKGLKILDDYDHQTMESKSTKGDTYVLTYEECKEVISQTVFMDKGDLFGLEKNDSFKSAISTIYQSFDEKDLYPTFEDKAANLFYLITKNHAYADGNKRIAATIFLYFLEKNKVLNRNGKQLISNTTLATLTILVASSNPNDKQSIINLIKLLISDE